MLFVGASRFALWYAGVAPLAKASDQAEVIVLIELGALGDSIMTLPAMRAVRRARPQAHIVRVHERQQRLFFRDCPLADTFIEYDRGQSKLAAATALLCSLRRLRPAVVANLHTPDFARPFWLYARDAAFLLLSGARQRLAWTHSLDALAITHGTARRLFGHRRIDLEMLAVVSSLGVAPDDEPFTYWLTATERETTLRLWRQQAGLAGVDPTTPYFCVSPFARATAREWLFPEMGRAISAIALASGLVPALLGGPGDRDKLAVLTPHITTPFVDLVGSSDIRDAATVLASATFTLAVDSGLMHLSALVGTAVVALFGPGNPERWHPLPQVETRIVYAHPECGPCFRRACPDLRCQKQITPDTVAATALELWRDRKDLHADRVLRGL